MTLDHAIADLPVVAIIRGVTPDEAVETAQALYDGGVRAVEVPLNSPEPFRSIRAIVDALGDRMAVGSGTVLTPEGVDRTAEAGGRLVVSPNTEPAVIRRTVELGLESLPGFATPSEAFMAIAAGARRLKLFPAASFGSGHVKQVRAVLPPDAEVWAVGGVGAADMAEWLAAGARGFGVGSELYRSGQSPADTRAKAEAFARAWRGISRG